MTPERSNKVKDLLATALEVAPTERATYLDQHCAGGELPRRSISSRRTSIGIPSSLSI
jgi:hypothetical protein